MDWENLVRTETLSVPDRLSIDLERLILDGTLPPGERLPSERELAEMLKVSRVSIRQALRELENHGLIDRRPGRGTIVLAPGNHLGDVTGIISRALGEVPGGQELHHVMELRAILEPPIARITAGRATSRDISQLRGLVIEMESDVSPTRYVELDKAFHQAIAQYTHNPLLASLNEQIMGLISPSRAKVLQTKSRRAESSAAHRRIFEAIEAGDGELAAQAALNHVRAISEEIHRVKSGQEVAH